MFFDGVSRTGPKVKIVARVGLIFLSPHNHVLPHVFSLTEPYSNNVAEHMLCSLASSSPDKWGYNILKPIVPPS